jgi:lactam utilization protein B
MRKKLINCDLGESLMTNSNVDIVPLIDMANIDRSSFNRSQFQLLVV